MLNVLSFWSEPESFGFAVLNYECSEDDEWLYRALFGVTRNKEDKRWEIDLFWKVFTL